MNKTACRERQSAKTRVVLFMNVCGLPPMATIMNKTAVAVAAAGREGQA